VPIVAQHFEIVRQRWPDIDQKRAVAETIRQMINTLIMDVTTTTQANLDRTNPANAEAAKQLGPLVAFSPQIRAQADELKRFLLKELYRHYRVLRMTGKAKRVVRQLFEAFWAEPGLLAPDHRRQDRLEQARAIADYIAGMTDRYAMLEHRKLFQMDESL